MTKTKFILKYPALPARDVVKLGAKSGVVFTEQYVATVRYNARKSRSGKRAPPSTPAAAPSTQAAIAAPKRRIGRPRKAAPVAVHLHEEISPDQARRTLARMIWSLGHIQTESLLREARTMTLQALAQ